MPQSTRDPHPVSDLGALLEDVIGARQDVAEQRGLRPNQKPDGLAARSKLLAALEAYAKALAAAGRPLPYRLRDELFLFREISKRRGY